MRKLVFTICTALAWLACAPALGAQANQDVERAFAAVLAGANAGDGVAQFSLGSILYYGDYGAQHTAAAADGVRKDASDRHSAAGHPLGQLFDVGFGGAEDDAA